MNLPHLGIDDIGVQKLGKDKKYWLVHGFCPKRARSPEDKWHIISFDCYSEPEIALCSTCGRRFGKRALVEIKARTERKVEFWALAEMQKYAAEANNGSRAFHAHLGFQPRQD